MPLVHSMSTTNYTLLRLQQQKEIDIIRQNIPSYIPLSFYPSKILSLLRANKLLSMPNLHKVQVSSSNAICEEKEVKAQKVSPAYWLDPPYLLCFLLSLDTSHSRLPDNKGKWPNYHSDNLREHRGIVSCSSLKPWNCLSLLASSITYTEFCNTEHSSGWSCIESWHLLTEGNINWWHKHNFCKYQGLINNIAV